MLLAFKTSSSNRPTLRLFACSSLMHRGEGSWRGLHGWNKRVCTGRKNRCVGSIAFSSGEIFYQDLTSWITFSHNCINNSIICCSPVETTLLLRCHARRECFWPKIATFSPFQICLNVTQAKQMISSLLLNNFYHTDEFERRRKRRAVVYGSVTRYGPRTSCQRKRLKRTIRVLWYEEG